MIDETFKLIAKDGREVKVRYESHGLNLSHPCPHLEFRGFAISETGYFSHFFGDFYEEVNFPTLEQAKELAERLLEEKYLPPQVKQASLF